MKSGWITPELDQVCVKVSANFETLLDLFGRRIGLDSCWPRVALKLFNPFIYLLLRLVDCLKTFGVFKAGKRFADQQPDTKISEFPLTGTQATTCTKIFCAQSVVAIASGTDYKLWDDVFFQPSGSKYN